MDNLPGLNFDSKLSIQDLKVLADIYEQQFLSRTLVVFGAYNLSEPRYGIIDSISPRSIVSTETSRPLLVYQSLTNNLLLNITPGSVVNANGTLVTNPSLIEGFSLTSVNAEEIHVVYIENSIEDAAPYRITIYNNSQPVRRVQSTSVIKSDLLSNYENAVLYPPTKKANITVLAVVTVVSTTSGLDLKLDYTNSNYSFNRPWYSPVDFEHRSKLGTGVITDNNVHALSYNDLTSGNLSLYDQFLPTGMIQSRDDKYKGLPGYFCSETITPARLLVDSGGNITSDSVFGGVGANYIVLANYPTSTMSMYISTHQSRAIAYDWIPGTRIVVIPTPELFTSNATIEYQRVAAAEPPNATVSNTITFGQPDVTKELIYTGGLALDTLIDPSIDFDGSGPFPRVYNLYATPAGSLIRSPQPIDVTITLDNIAPGPFPSAIYSISQSLFGPAKIKIGLADANSTPTMSITVRLYGEDAAGSPLPPEDLVFSGTTWTPVAIPGSETAGQFIQSTNVFSLITGIQIINRVNDGPNSKIRLFAELESGTTLGLNTLALVASVNWDGLAISNIKDLRQVSTVLKPTLNRYAPVSDLIGNGSVSSLAPVLVEDIQVPSSYETASGYTAATFSFYTIYIDDYSLIASGDTIQLRPLKTVTAITTGTPNRAIGEFKAFTDNASTASDLILTINDPTFNSGITATASGSESILCTKQASGAAGNETVVLTLADVSSITLSSVIGGKSTGGYDAFGEIYLDRHLDFVDTVVPNPSTYDVTGYRTRYMSKAFPTQSKNRIKIQVFGTDRKRVVQLRTRIAMATDIEWQPWVVQTLVGTQVEFTNATGITKIQVELFGYFSGVAVFEGDI
jgi:hypothetical protein